MRITFEGRDWELDLEAITLKQGVAMHMAYGFTVDGWLTALGDADPRALQVLYWLMLQQDGQHVAVKDADCRIVDLATAFAEITPEDEAEPDPTQPPQLSPPEGPPSPEPATPTAGTRPHHARQEGGRPIASTPGI